MIATGSCWKHFHVENTRLGFQDWLKLLEFSQVDCVHMYELLNLVETWKKLHVSGHKPCYFLHILNYVTKKKMNVTIHLFKVAQDCTKPKWKDIGWNDSSLETIYIWVAFTPKFIGLPLRTYGLMLVYSNHNKHDQLWSPPTT